jgi:hypothetical protein
MTWYPCDTSSVISTKPTIEAAQSGDVSYHVLDHRVETLSYRQEISDWSQTLDITHQLSTQRV